MPYAIAIALLCTAAALADEYTCDFSGRQLDVWALHQEGAGVAAIVDGALVLDMSAAEAGKHAWADLRLTLKLPATLEWEQEVRRDSDHFYQGGLYLRDAAGGMATAGLTGKPLGHVAHLTGARGKAALPPGRRYRLKLQVGPGTRAELTVSDPAGGDVLDRLTGSFGTLRGALCSPGFYHNQPRNEGPDAYAQDRGICAFDKLQIAAAAISQSELDSYRDLDLRAYDRRSPMTFNRTTTWVASPETGLVLAYDRADEVMLTGTRRASAWLENRLCRMEDADAETGVFARPNDLDGYDCVAVPSFQWCVRQHPVLEYSLQPGAGKCMLKVTLVCPYLGDGIEVYRSEESAGATEGRVDLWGIMQQRGLDYHQFGEIGVFIYQDRPADPEAEQGTCRARVSLTGPGALLTTPPVIRTRERAAAGVPIAAIFPGSDGELRHGAERRISASVEGGAPIELREEGGSGVFGARLFGLEPGEHRVLLTAAGEDGTELAASTTLVVTDGDFIGYKPGGGTYQTRSGRVLPTLQGDLYAWVPMLEAASLSRRPVLSTAQWETLSPEQRGKVSLIKLRTLSREEVRAQLQAHRDNGMRVVRLTPNVSSVESYLDAGGHVSMHGLESLLMVLGECRRLGMVALINLFHYPYGSAGTGRMPPWRQYLDAGYKGDASFTTPEIGVMLKQYLSELLGYLRDDTAIVAYSLTGENDQVYGPEWINAMHRHVMACDPNHMVTQEQGGGAQHCSGGTPWGYEAFEPTKSAGLGYRTYYTEGMKSDAYFMTCGRFYAANPPVFTAEFASGPGWYGPFHVNWSHPDFLTKVRDNCWAALLCRQTMCLSWSAPWTQEERLIPQTCAELIDRQSFRRRTPEVAVRVAAVDKDTLRRLSEIEAALARLGVDYDYLWEGRGEGPEYTVVLEPADDPAKLALPESVLSTRPLRTTGGFSVSYLLSDDGTQLIGYIRNTAQYKLGAGYGTGVEELHRQRTERSDLTLTLQGFAPEARYRLYDVDTRELARSGRCAEAKDIHLGPTSHDYALVWTCAER